MRTPRTTKILFLLIGIKIYQICGVTNDENERFNQNLATEPNKIFQLKEICMKGNCHYGQQFENPWITEQVNRFSANTMKFKVFTLNCWGIALICPDREKRMTAIAEFLSNSTYDVVCFQEIWVHSDFQFISDKVQGVLPHSHYFHSGVFGSGVAILSKHPMEDIFFHQWSVNGYIHKIQHADWFGGKGVGLCKLRVGKYKVNVYSAHLHAEYNRECDEYQAHRVLQAFDAAQFIQMTSSGADLVLLAGDLNTEPGDLAYRILLNVTGLIDAYSQSDKSEEPEDGGATYLNSRNTYTSANEIRGQRIDYIMYHSGSNLHIRSQDYRMPLPEKVPQSDFSYSDHEAIAATLLITDESAPSDSKADHEEKRAVLEQSLAICEDALKGLNKHRLMYFFYSFVLFVLLITVFVSTPLPFYGLNFFCHVVKVFIIFFMLYTLMMATIWDRMERHAIVAGKLAMQCHLKRL